MKEWIKALPKQEIEERSSRCLRVAGHDIVLCRLSDDQVCAVANCCSHDGKPFSDGPIKEDQLRCPRHGARFDVRTGAVRRPPAFTPLVTYPTRVAEDDTVEVELEPRS